MLKIEGLEVFYGGSQVLFKVSLELRDGEIISILGRNGAGKTTIIKSIIGLIKPRGGSITFDGRNLTSLAPEEIARLGVAYVPDTKRLFPHLTVKENLQVSAIGCGNPKLSFDNILDYFPQLKPLLNRKAGNLSGGEQQMVTITRALIRKPALVLLDEPSQGLAPLIVERVRKAITDINKESQTGFLVVEQEIAFAIGVATRVYGLLSGSVVYEGSTDEFVETKAFDKFMAVC
jgi:branched-chain amino acid transport system ATP-binding protein